ncbi:hypothetical protein [Cryptosporangium aurantiacum]|uniref:DUF2568 domain-containing protein n=1 Tax=Cryptosporangium aurantiacum TaxID=134849 RepID=A0A1M7PBE4_9ACTN|nr:hypothetical protein [Cryptosporangium aurantiacum]SHN14140.1 hypothetical protein SAMN05443668_103157 [Cryptosporangium aurantiacum]
MGACLRTDAAYCALAALILGLFAGPVGGALGVPAGVPFAAAVLTFGWAGVLLVLASRRRLRGPVRFVLVANVVAAAGLAALALTRPLDALSLLLLAVAVEVSAFAVWQAVLLRPARG